MTIKNRIKKQLRFTTLMSILLLCSCFGKNKLNRMAYMNTHYPMFLSNTQRNGAVSATSTSSGIVAWRKKVVSPPDMDMPDYILAVEEKLLVVFPQKISTRDSVGEELWALPIWTKLPVVLFDNCVYFHSAQDKGLLRKANLDGAVDEAKITVPSAQEKAKPIYLEPSSDGFFMGISSPSFEVPGDGELERIPASHVFYYKKYDDWDFVWVGEGPGELIHPPLHLKNSNKFCIFTESSIGIYNSATTQENGELLKEFKYPIESMSIVSADDQGTLYMLGRQEKEQLLVACGTGGTEQWRWSRQGVVEINKQPPVVCPNGEIIVSAGNVVCAVKEGKTQWEIKTSMNSPEFFTVDAQNTILVAAGSVLYAIKNGNVEFECDIGSRITAPPIIDGNGSIFILAGMELIKVT